MNLLALALSWTGASRPLRSLVLLFANFFWSQANRNLYRVLAILACLVLSVVCAPWAAQGMSNLISLTATNNLGPLLNPPFYLVPSLAGATAIGCLPVIYLWRTGRW